MINARVLLQLPYNGGHLASSFSFPRSSAAPATFGRVYFDAPKPRRFQVLALSVKRSPKPQILRSLASPRSSLSVLKCKLNKTLG
ncbi:hypothetical protein DVH24_040634 [Malus domestica]|uniref:Uncharacterized protein n=1 Tax=Malus domestica TaxID=3750 RepID=A0A498IBV4_MALDO|nr:hypothetical protein DVH24_040634 [Malus domestica]